MTVLTTIQVKIIPSAFPEASVVVNLLGAE
jgi:hypothetical protein